MKTIHVFKRLLQYVSKYKFKLVLLTLLALAGVVFEVAKPLPIKLVVDNVLSAHPLPDIVTRFTGTELLSDKKQLLFICIALMAVITVGSAAMSLLVSTLMVNVSQRLVYDLSVDFFGKLQRLSLTFYQRNQVGDLLQRINGDVFVVYFLVAQIALPAVTSLICLATMFYIMVKIDLALALVASAVVPLLTIALAFFIKPMNDTTTSQYTTQGQLSAFLQQSLSSMKIIQAFGREPFMYRKLEGHAMAFGQAFRVATKVSMTYNQLTLFITGLATTALVGLGAYRGLQGNLSAGDLFVFVGYVSALYGPVNSLSTAVGAAIAIGARGRRVFDILDSDEVVKEKPSALSLPDPQGAIEFRNVTFGYDTTGSQARPVLQNISFKVSPGQVVAIVGPTGAGKTSLISLLTRFYDPWQGNVLLDGTDLRDLKLHSLRENISIVLQEPFLFPMTIAENIAFGNPDATFEEIVEAAKAAQAHHFISKLPLGYDTKMSEAGASLSGGEKQRISIARAFLKKAAILILDEPTSAVDALTEAKIFEALSIFSKGKTVFLISHRLSTLKHADQIITIKNGVVAEQGTHQSLLANEKDYADLYKYQHIT
jgi:ABC-type multidrug transport system fused ATPase/permease subunit